MSSGERRDSNAPADKSAPDDPSADSAPLQTESTKKEAPSQQDQQTLPETPLMRFHREFPNVDRSMVRPLYVPVPAHSQGGPQVEPGSANEGAAAAETDEASRRYYEALAQTIADTYARFTPEEMELVKALGWG